MNTGIQTMMGIGRKDLSNARRPGESFKAYRERQKRNKNAIKDHLKGCAIWVSCIYEAVRNPVTGQVENVIRRTVQGTKRGGW